jgi:formylglycine-generating enzyme required for sulfatase activity
VRNVSWRTAHTVLQRWGLAMPTVAQWVWAVQLSTKPAPAADWTMVPAGIRSNMRDACYEASSWGRPLPVGLPDDTWDGFAFTCPVDALAPNPCGLFGMLGNVAEFVRDGYQEQPPEFAEGPEQRTVDAEQIGEAMVLGGSFLVPDKLKAEHFTQPIALQNVEVTIGVRAVMPWPEAGRNEK